MKSAREDVKAHGYLARLPVPGKAGIGLRGIVIDTRTDICLLVSTYRRARLFQSATRAAFFLTIFMILLELDHLQFPFPYAPLLWSDQEGRGPISPVETKFWVSILSENIFFENAN